MFKRYIPFNIALLIITAMIGYHTAGIWLIPVKPETVEDVIKPFVKQPPPQPVPPPDYQVIIEKDIFRPSRIKPMEITAPKPLPKFNVTGIFLVGDKKMALIGIEEPKKNPKPVKIGDVIEDFKVVDILNNKVILEQNSERIEIVLKTPQIIPLKFVSKEKSLPKAQSNVQQAVEDEPPPPSKPRIPGAPPIKIIQAPPR